MEEVGRKLYLSETPSIGWEAKTLGAKRRISSTAWSFPMAPSSESQSNIPGSDFMWRFLIGGLRQPGFWVT
jgi:hypothetical protein